MLENLLLRGRWLLSLANTIANGYCYLHLDPHRSARLAFLNVLDLRDWRFVLLGSLGPRGFIGLILREGGPCLARAPDAAPPQDRAQ